MNQEIIPKLFFPEVDSADDEGFLGWSNDLNVEMLKEAYTSGIFPWPAEEKHILWFAPPERTILDFEDFRIPKTVARELKKMNFTFSVNQHFEEVIKGCAGAARNDEGTWITPKIIDAYIEFHNQGYAWSFEAIDPDGKLAGGLYGILINHYFAGESMFYKTPGASKFAFVNTVKWLQSNRNLTWLDAQMQNPFLARFGTKTIPRDEYMQLLNIALKGKL
jgi:leucyl/phenylalanyl-tRNA--protein transferase